MMVERYPNYKDEVGGSNSGCEISSLLARWSTASVLWPSVSKKKLKTKKSFMSRI
jgi:hypothetical protein